MRVRAAFDSITQHNSFLVFSYMNFANSLNSRTSRYLNKKSLLIINSWCDDLVQGFAILLASNYVKDLKF